MTTVLQLIPPSVYGRLPDDILHLAVKAAGGTGREVMGAIALDRQDLVLALGVLNHFEGSAVNQAALLQTFAEVDTLAGLKRDLVLFLMEHAPIDKAMAQQLVDWGAGEDAAITMKTLDTACGCVFGMRAADVEREYPADCRRKQWYQDHRELLVREWRTETGRIADGDKLSSVGRGPLFTTIANGSPYSNLSSNGLFSVRLTGKLDRAIEQRLRTFTDEQWHLLLAQCRSEYDYDFSAATVARAMVFVQSA